MAADLMPVLMERWASVVVLPWLRPFGVEIINRVNVSSVYRETALLDSLEWRWRPPAGDGWKTLCHFSQLFSDNLFSTVIC